MLIKVQGITVQDDTNLPDDSGEVPKSNGVVGGSILGHEIVTIRDGKLAKSSSASFEN